MNREIKFRAWDIENKRMIYFNAYEQWGFINSSYSRTATSVGMNRIMISDDPELFTWMQFTGLLDKNGKEIYEGDIIIWQDTGSNYPNIMHKKEVVQWGNIGWDGFSPIYENEVIGNIHENKELLT